MTPAGARGPYAVGWWVVEIGGVLSPAQLRAAALVTGPVLLAEGVLVCDLRRLSPVTIDAVDSLARVALMAKATGRPLRIRGMTGGLVDLLRWTGLGSSLGSVQRQSVRRPGGSAQRS